MPYQNTHLPYIRVSAARIGRRCSYGTAAVLALGLALAACKTTPPPEPMGAKLSEAELKAHFVDGQAWVATGKSVESGREWQITADGTGNQEYLGKSDGSTHVGTHRVVGDTMCWKWKTIRDGAERCLNVFVQEDGTYQSYHNGKISSRYTVAKVS